MKVTLSNHKIAEIAIAGHVGCGHSHSLNGQVQDDSVGLSVLLELFKEAAPLSLIISKVTGDNSGNVEVELESGGIGKGYALRGITPHEKLIMQNLIGKEAVCTHTIVAEVFGRFYGQGATELPVALQTAISNATLDSFAKKYPNNFIYTEEGIEGNCGKILGTILEIENKPVAALATVNATWGGIGPNEDVEGNSNHYKKADILKELSMTYLPTIVVEAIAFNASSKGLIENTFFARAHDEDDNPYVADSIIKAAQSLNLHSQRSDVGMKRVEGTLKNNTAMVADNIIRLAEILKTADDCKLKVQTVAELNRYVSQDAGGVTFMSSTLHQDIGGAGVTKTTSGVLNLIVTEDYIKNHVIPCLDKKMLSDYVSLVKAATLELYKVKDISNAHVKN